MKAIENNRYKASSITLSLNDYLNLNNTIERLEKENELLRQEKIKLQEFPQDEVQLE